MTRAADDFDALAGAFLTPGKPSRQRRDAACTPTLLVVGNVPTLAGIWIAQFADQMARTKGPVALVRLDGAASRGEMFRGQGRAFPGDATAWMERAGAITRNWVLCVDSRAEASAIVASGCPIVILSGTDEAALAALRRKIELIDSAARETGLGSMSVGLALVGSAEDLLKDSATRLATWASDSRLAVRPHLAMHAPRVERVESTGPVPLSMFSALDEPSAAELIELAMEGHPTRLAPPAIAAPVIDEPPMPVERPVESAPKSRPAQVVAVADGIDLFPELARVPFECPDAPGVALGCDQEGALHLIAQAAESHALKSALSWARGNWRLLRAAHPTLKGESPNVVEHLVLDDAREAISLHRTGVLLHTVVTAQSAAGPVRVRVDLNDSATARSR